MQNVQRRTSQQHMQADVRFFAQFLILSMGGALLVILAMFAGMFLR